MVFESVVTDVLNRVLGDYVENLDSKQLKIGIWGGDVVLTNLVLKPSALDDLDLPVQTVYGRLGKLVLKIPWKNLYGAAVEASIEGLYLLVVPNQQVKYDAEKEEKKEAKNKQNDLQKFEDAKKKEAEKNKPKPDDTFVEKLTTQIIKNVQLNITNIHIRYEDKITRPNHPFAMGITLSKLSLATTDETWKPTIVQEMVTKIYKVVSLEGLAVYWNCNSVLYATLPTVDLINHFNNEIATKATSPTNYHYMLGPINSSARLRLNPKPDCDTPEFSIPKVHLNLEMEKLFIGISKAQYQDVIALAESMDRMSRGMPYLQFRPVVSSYKGHYKKWWHFAYACVLEDVRRRRRNWDWNHIIRHRTMCKEYATAYQTKLLNKKVPQNVQTELDLFEKKLDIFNIVIIRQKIELEVARIGRVQAQVQSKSWFSSWWGSPSEEDKELEESTDIMKKFEAAMTPEEKGRLYQAIDYQENSAPLEFPEAYVDNSCTFVLRSLEIQVRDDLSVVPRVVSTELKGVKCRLDTRPAASAIKVAVNIDEFAVHGLEQDDLIPQLVTSKTNSGEDGALLDVLFETNPLDKTCAQRIHVNAKPLKIIYDAQTVNKIVDVFKTPPESSALEQLSAAAENSLSNFKEMSAIGLQHAIEKHTVLDLKVDLHAPYVIIPYGGKYTGIENVLVVNLGQVKISSASRTGAEVRHLHAKGAAEREILDEMIEQSYDKFILEFTDLQIVLAQGGEDWTKYVNESCVTPLHLLSPVSLNIIFHKCLISDDPRLPLAKIRGQLPSIAVNITDVRLLLLVALAASIPLPEESPPENKPLLKSSRSHSSSLTMLKYLELPDKAKTTKASSSLEVHTKHTGDFVQFTTLDVKFVMKELSVVVSHQEMSASPSEEIANFKINSLEFDLIQQTYNTGVTMRLGGIGCGQFHKNKHIDIISTPLKAEAGDYLFIVKFMQVDKKSPEFHSKHQSCESRLSLEFSSLNVILHQEGLQSLKKFATELQMQMEELQNPVATNANIVSSFSSVEKVRRMSSVAETLVSGVRTSKTMISLMPDKKPPKVVVIETIQFKLTAHLQELMVLFACDKHEIASCTVKGITSEVIVKKSYTQVVARLLNLTIMDKNPNSIHKKILTVSSEEAVNAQVVMYNAEHKSSDPNSIDISVQATMGCLRIVFLNWFVTNMLDFLNQFQTAQATIIEASHAAAQTAKQNMQNAYENATRISLNIDLKAPDIIVPVSSQSCDALLLDLGHIMITNRFITLDIKNEQDQNAVLDEMKLNLTNFTLARIKLDEENATVSKCPLLQPVSFSLIVKRNLSTSWYKAVPDIDLSGKLDTIKVLLSQSDFQTTMSILSGNLSEGQQQPLPATPAPVKSEAQFAVLPKSSDDTLGSKEPHKLLVNEDQQMVYTTVKFTFTMESFIINLFSSSAKTQPDLLSTHDPKDALACFSLEGLALKGRILSDNSIATSVLLVNCLMDDMRKGRENKLNRLIERKQDMAKIDTTSVSTSLDSNPPRSMIDITFQLKGNDMFADVRVYSFTVILSVDYLLKIAEFFTSAMQSDEVNKINKSNRNNVALKDAPSNRTATVSKSSTVITEKESTMTLNLRVEKPDIILVEHMDNIEANALILNSEIIMKLRTSGAHQVISGSISDIQLYTCCYDPARRAETRGPVLHPVSISVAGSTPEGQGLHIEVCITDVRISVSPSTIELLNRVYSTMYGGDAAQVDSDSKFDDYLNIWDYKPYSEQDFWFLKAETAEDAFESIGGEIVNEELSSQSNNTLKIKELCIVSLPSLIITIEAGVGNKTLPMLLLESSFQGTVNDWSSQMNVEASLTLQIGYYNSRLALWEPLIEPVPVTNDNKIMYAPWELKLEVSMCEPEEASASTPTGESEEERLQIQSAAMSIDISSKSNLELTVTKTALEVLNNLGKAFQNAIAMGAVKSTEISAPYKVKNESGLKVTLCLDKGAFKVYGQDGPIEVVLESGTEVPLQLKPSLEKDTKLHLEREITQSSFKVLDRFLHVQITDLMKCNLELPVVRADKRYFLLQHRGENNDSWGLVSAVTVEEGVLIITLRSILQVHNHFNTAVDVYYMTARGNELECISSIEPGSSMNVPLKAVYTPTNELFFSIPGYSVTSTPFIWKDLQLNLSVTKVMHCTPKASDGSNEPFVIKAVGETEQIYHENTTRHTMASTSYNIHLHPAVTLKNCLPVNIICCIQNIADEKFVKPGEVLQMPNVDPGTSRIVIRLPDYLEKEWSCQHDVAANPQAFSVWQFDSYDSVTKVSLDLGMHVLIKGGSMVMSLYCPFWMLNKTGLLIGYRKSKKTEKNEASGSPAKSSDESLNILHHPATFKGPVLFSFNAKNFFGKKKASVRVEQGEWSDKFSLDVAGSSGFVVCKANNTIYQIGVHNQLTYNGLTKQVTFTPYYVIINNAPFAIECQELDRPADSWTRVEENSCSALWPRSERDDKLLKLRVVGTEEISAPFLYTETHTTLLKLQNKFGGINVDIQLTEGAVYINLTAYEPGMAPALIINHTTDAMSLWEKETVQIRKLNPSHKALYTWENPSGPRVLVWDIGHKKELEDDLRKDGVGEFSPEEDYHIYWVSFLDGMQRILLFTMDKVVAENVQSAKQFEAIQQEINVSIHGLGLSLVNNQLRQEIMYVGIASSGIIWESCKLHSKRYKQMNPKDSINMENAFQFYLNKQQVSTMDFGRALVDSKTEVDFETGYMLKPHKRKIRRTFQTGLWLQMKTSPNQLQLHAKVNRLQIDNQMFDCIFPVVLAPVPPPKSVAGDNIQKPFAELSIVQRLIKYSQIRQFKYFKVLIQEFHIKVDLGFVNAVVGLLQSSEYSEQEEKDQFLKDVSLVDEPLLAHVSTKSLQEQKNFYDLLHFSPLKVHVSFSMQSGSVQGADTPNFLNVLLQGLGVTLTDMQDVVFRLAYFEREYTFLTQRQLISEATTHYVGQSVKQLYVLVLGLDVLGNPYGLVLGITKGVEDLFYEPFQGAIQGPGEFAEGLVLGVRSLFGHTVGGAAGAVSRITGAMGKGIAALTFDKDYQRKRRDQINKKPATVQEGIARGGKGLVMGVVDGVTGVFTKPISGAKEQGVEGFFKGLGKGAVGLVTRPTAGVIDFASGSLDAVKRAAELGEEANRLRPPRFLQADGLVRPYNRSEADGHKFLTELEKGKYATTDIYTMHFIIIDKKEILMLTDKRLAYITHNDIFGGWQIDWAYTWQELQNPPRIVPKGIAITTLEIKKKKLGLFGSNETGKIILVGDAALRDEICNKIEELIKNA